VGFEIGEFTGGRRSHSASLSDKRFNLISVGSSEREFTHSRVSFPEKRHFYWSKRLRVPAEIRVEDPLKNLRLTEQIGALSSQIYPKLL
jgi:hypothetical protein